MDKSIDKPDLNLDPESINFETLEEFQKVFDKYNQTFIETTKMMNAVQDERDKIVKTLIMLSQSHKTNKKSIDKSNLNLDPESINSETQEEYNKLFDKYNQEFLEKTKIMQTYEEERQKIIKVMKTLYQCHQTKFESSGNKSSNSNPTTTKIHQNDCNDEPPDNIKITI